MDELTAGFREIPHTADWEIEVWALTLPDLFTQAARGMYALAQARLEAGKRSYRKIALLGADAEMLLVGFLSELLYLGEQEGLIFDRFEIHIDGGSLNAVLGGAPAGGPEKPIKAVTYHNLQIRQTERGYTAHIVFDV